MVLTSESYRSLEKDKTFINTKTHCPVHAGYSELGVSLPFSGQALLYLTVTHYLLCNVTHNLNVLGNGFRILTITLFGNSLIENSYSSTGDIFHFTYMRKLMVSVMSISATRPPTPPHSQTTAWAVLPGRECTILEIFLTVTNQNPQGKGSLEDITGEVIIFPF